MARRVRGDHVEHHVGHPAALKALLLVEERREADTMLSGAGPGGC